MHYIAALRIAFQLGFLEGRCCLPKGVPANKTGLNLPYPKSLFRQLSLLVKAG